MMSKIGGDRRMQQKMMKQFGKGDLKLQPQNTNTQFQNDYYMNSFEVKRGHGKTLENGGLKSIMEEEFGDVNEDGNIFSASFKALKINVELVSITEIKVDTENDPEASPEDLQSSHQAYNRFMESATSFTAKERVKRAKAKAKKEAKAAAEKEMQS